MMKEHLKDKGLRKAMTDQPMHHRLSTNFTFRTMLKVEEYVRMQERKQERRMLFAVVAASLLLLAGGGVTIVYYWGDTLWEAFAALFSAIPQSDLLSSPYWMLSSVCFILLGLDYWLRRRYYKRHNS